MIPERARPRAQQRCQPSRHRNIQGASPSVPCCGRGRPHHAQSQLDTPTLTIDNGNSGQLIGHMPAVSNAHSYQIQVLTPDGKVLKTVDSTQARNVVIPGLTPGIIYTLIGRAVGGSTGYSDWSDPVSHMCM